MHPFDIYIAYVSWLGGGKTRPVLVLNQQATDVSVFSITAQYEGKSEAVRSKYYRINDWQQAGLDRPSYVDTNTVRVVPKAILAGKSKIGRLSAADELRLIEFIDR